MTELIHDLVVSSFIDLSAEHFPQQAALETEDEVITYRELRKNTCSLCSGLIQIGVCKGEHIGIWASLSSKTIEMFFSIQRSGAVVCMIHNALPQEALKTALTDADIDYLVCDHDHLCKLKTTGILNSLKAVIVLEGKEPNTVSYKELFLLGKSLPTLEREKREMTVCPSDPAVMLYTSGTTGKPKIVVTSHFARINNGIQQAADMKASSSDKFLVALPLYHCFSLSANLYAALSVGACLYLPKSRHAQDLIEGLSKGRCTILNAVPTQFESIIENSLFQEGITTTLRTGVIGGGGYSPMFFKQVEEKLGITLLSSLGMTECTAGVTVCSLDDDISIRSSTLGHVMAHMEIKIVDVNTAQPVTAGLTGEICFRGYSVMDGYYNHPELTRSVIDPDGWFHTGDCGHMTGTGDLVLDGRIKELIIRGGENVYPIEIETAVLNLAGVSTCKAVGVPNKHYGECVCLFVVPCKGVKLNGNLIKAALQECLEYYKIPEKIFFLDELPVTDLGKTDVIELKRLAQQARDVL